MLVLHVQTTKTTSLAAGGQLGLSAGLSCAEAVSPYRVAWRKGDMLNPLHLAFAVLGRILDLIVLRPQARSGPAVAWRSASSQFDGVEFDAAASREGVDVNRATGTGRDVGARRVTNASPEWAARLRDAQARANARRIAS